MALDYCLTAIGSYLKRLFPDFNVYTENPDQGLVEPAIVVTPVATAERERVMGYVRADDTYSVAILTGDTGRLRAVSEIALTALKAVPVDGGRPFLGTHRELAFTGDGSAVISFRASRTVELPKPDVARQEVLFHTTEVSAMRDKSKKTDPANKIAYTGAAIAASEAFAPVQWAASVCLDPERTYTQAEAEALIDEFLKRRV